VIGNVETIVPVLSSIFHLPSSTSEVFTLIIDYNFSVEYLPAGKAGLDTSGYFRFLPIKKRMPFSFEKTSAISIYL